MIDANFVNSIASQNIELILKQLNIGYKVENGWICIKCIFHHGEKYNLKFRGKAFYCFSECRRQYSIFDIVMQVLDIDFVHAVKWIADLLGITSDAVNTFQRDNDIVDRKAVSKLSSIKKQRIRYQPLSQDIINTVDFNYYHPWILEQFTKETCQYFNIGFGLYGALKSRIVFPIDSPDGQFISLSGRMPLYEITGVPKYYILGHSQVKNTLYNISRVKPNLDEYNNIIIVEGFKSVMALHQYGYDNALATIGASLSKEQKHLLLKMCKPITVICDNDRVGEKFGQSVQEKMNKFVDVQVINLSDYTDKEKASVDDLTEEQWQLVEQNMRT